MEISITLAGMNLLIDKLSHIKNEPEMRQALLDSASVIEYHAKKNLQEMVYDKPLPKGYPSRKHGAGMYGATQASGKIEEATGFISTEVGTNIDYAVYVHMGTGIYALNGDGRKTPWVFKDEEGTFHWTVGQHPKPYLTKGANESKKEINAIFTSAVTNLFNRIGRK